LKKIDFKSIDFKKYQKYFGAHSSGDLNRFLEDLPQNAGKTVLIAGAIVWGLAAASGLFATVKAQQLTELRATLKETEALKPSVPTIKNVPIAKASVENFVDQAKKAYRGVNMQAQGSSITITASSTTSFTEFREALGHVQNGGDGWRVALEKLCVGRECGRRDRLVATVKVNKVTVQAPKL